MRFREAVGDLLKVKPPPKAKAAKKKRAAKKKGKLKK